MKLSPLLIPILFTILPSDTQAQLSRPGRCGRPQIASKYPLGTDPFGGGVTYDLATLQRAPVQPQDPPPQPQVWNRHDWLDWLHRGYQGGESGYHGPFDNPR